MRFLVPLFVFSCMLLTARVDAHDNVRLIHADRSGVDFEVTAGEPEIVDLASARTGLRLLGFSPEPEDIASDDLPSLVVWIGVPEGADVSVSATPLEVETREAVAPALQDRESEALATLKTTTGLRRQRVAAIEIHPARYDAGARAYVIATRLAVRVSFAGGHLVPAAVRDEPGFEDIYRDLLLNYESARAFRRPNRLARTTDSPFEETTSWIKVSVDGKGIQEIRGSDLQTVGAPIGSVDPAALRLFTRPGVPLVDEAAPCDTCGLAEVAIRVDDGGDGHFDASDRILFFGLGASGWKDDFTGPLGAPDEWLDHPYETHNVYWLTWDPAVSGSPLRVSSRDVFPSRLDAVPAANYPARLHVEKSLRFTRNFFEPGIPWDQWYWAELIDQLGPQLYTVDAAGADTTKPVRSTVRMWGISSETRPGRTLPDHVLDVWLNDAPLARLSWSGHVRRDVDTTMSVMRAGTNRLVLRAPLLLDPGNQLRSDRQALLFWELRYARRFQVVSDTAEFRAPDSAGVFAYSLAPFPSAVPESLLVLDVSDPLRPVALVSWQASDTSGGKVIHFHDDGTDRVYFAAAGAGFRRPTLAPAQVRNVRSGGADYLILCADDLESEALDLASHRRSFPPFPGATTAVVRLSDVLAWYAGGRMDPMAIRDFLHDAIVNGRWSPAPSTLCLLGDATYDFKNVYRLSDLSDHQVPTDEHGFVIEGYSTDDGLVDLDSRSPYGLPDLIVGRIPAANAMEANTMVAKIVGHEGHAARGEWRNRLLLVSDDTQQRTQPDPLGGTFLFQADSLARRYFPFWLDRDQVYLSEYELTDGLHKRGAEEAVIRHLDSGAAIWHFVGRANQVKLADESAFEIGDVARLANGPRLPLFYAATSTVAPFDDPVLTSLGESMVKRPDGGSVATYASTRVTFSSSDFSLSRAFYDALFGSPGRTIGEASYLAKHRFDASFNDRGYTILGDPAMRMVLPPNDVRIRLFDDETDAALVDSIPVGRRIRLEAEVHGSRDSLVSLPLADFEGTASLRVSDSAPLVPYILASPSATWEYQGNPRTAFSGSFPVQGGRIVARFVLPVESALGPRARASVYVLNADADGSGAIPLQLFAEAAASPDTSGPRISVRFQSGRTLVGRYEPLAITLEDEDGIDVLPETNHGHILLAVDDTLTWDVTDRFSYEDGSWTRGHVGFQLPPLSDGPHSLRLEASDNLATDASATRHRTTYTFSFTVASLLDSTSVAAFAVPNPLSSLGGTLLVFTGFGQGTTAEIGIYDVAGRLVRKLDGRYAAGRRVQADWDGRDSGGRTLRSGVYFYRATLASAASVVHTFEGRLVLLR